MNNHSSSMYALLVGVNEYESSRVKNLSGCVNDVTAMGKMLSQKFDVPPENIQLLTNQQATNQGIKKAFETHLIARATAWELAGKQDPPPIFLFHFSGHGSRAASSRRAFNPDERDETIVPHDSRINGIVDIKDWELGELIDELTAPFNNEQANVTIIMDCCHSGSGTRDVESGARMARQIEPDLRPQPQRPSTDIISQSRSVGASGWMKGDKYVLLAGCRNDQVSWEIKLRNPDNAKISRGALTYFTIQKINETPANSRLTYRQLHEQVQLDVKNMDLQQTPQCEGQKDRQLFGGLVVKQSALFTVIEIDDKAGLIWIDGGMVHGLTKGSQLSIYPPDDEKSDQKNRPIARLVIKSVGAVKSACIVESGAKNIEILSKAKITHLNQRETAQYRVRLDIAESSLKQEIEALLRDDSVNLYVKLATEKQHANLQIQQNGEYLEILDSTGKQAVAPFAVNDLDDLPNELVHLARYHNALQLTNTDKNSKLSEKVSVEIKALDLTGNQASAVSITPNADGEIEVEVGHPIVIEVTNHAEKDLYLTVFNFAGDWSINQLHPILDGTHKAVKANGGQLALGLSDDDDDHFGLTLPEGSEHAREIIKVFATRAETDLAMYQMDPLERGSSSRGIAFSRKRHPPIDVEWTTAETHFHITRRKNEANHNERS